jgi:hypothetical protein
MTTWLDVKRQEDPDRQKCKCEDCGKRFWYGDEGDNERFCLRCERRSTRGMRELDWYEDDSID